MKYLKLKGFTLIEVVIFIIITGVIASTILLAGSTGLVGGVNSQNQIQANMLAQQCMEWLLGNRQLNGYSVLTCPSLPGGSLCASVSGFTLAASVGCTTLGADSTFKTITVVASGPNASATLRTLIADY